MVLIFCCCRLDDCLRKLIVLLTSITVFLLEKLGGDGGHSYPSLSELLDKRRNAFCDTIRPSEVVISEIEIAWIDIRI